MLWLEVLEFFVVQRYSVSFQDFALSLQLKNCFLIKKISVSIFFSYKCSYNVSKWKYFNHSFKSILKPCLVMLLFHPFFSFSKRSYSSLGVRVLCYLLWWSVLSARTLEMCGRCRTSTSIITVLFPQRNNHLQIKTWKWRKKRTINTSNNYYWERKHYLNQQIRGFALPELKKFSWKLGITGQFSTNFN